MTGGVTGAERRPAWLPRIRPDRQLGWYALAAAIVVFVVGELIQPGFASAAG